MNMSNKYPVVIDDCVLVGSELFFFAKNCNALFSLNLKEDEYKINLLGRIPDESIFGEGLVSNVIYFDNKLFLPPKKMKANKIWIFDLQTYNWNNVDIDLDDIQQPMEKIAYATIFKDELVMIGCYYDGIVRVNLNTYEIVYYKNMLDSEELIHSLFYCLKVDNNILIPSPNRNVISKLNLNSFECEKITIGNDNCAYLGICECKDYYWLAPRKNIPYIVKWDGKNDFYEFDVPEGIKDNGEYYFGQIANIDNSIYMVGGYGKKTLITNENISDYIITENGLAFVKKLSDDCYIIQDYSGNIELNYKGNKIDTNAFFEVEELRSDKFGKVVFETIFTETKKDSLSKFIDLIK